MDDIRALRDKLIEELYDDQATIVQWGVEHVLFEGLTMLPKESVFTVTVKYDR